MRCQSCSWLYPPRWLVFFVSFQCDVSIYTESFFSLNLLFQVLKETGNQDLCYYNFLCAYPLGFLSDFNHVYSNIGYVLLGLLFVGLVLRRDRMHCNAIANRMELERVFIFLFYIFLFAFGLLFLSNWLPLF